MKSLQALRYNLQCYILPCNSQYISEKNENGVAEKDLIP
jgi:hypothetical protein